MTLHEDLKAYIDGELDAERSKQVEAALSSNEELRAEASLLKALSKEIRAVAAEPQVQGLEDALSALQHAPSRHVSKRRLVFAFSGIAASMVLLVAVSPIFLQAKSGEQAARVSIVSENGAPQAAAAPARAAQEPADAGAFTDSAKFQERERGARGLVAAEEGPVPLTSQVALPDQKIVRSAQIALAVPDVQDVQARIIGLAHSLSGYVEESAGNNSSATTTANLNLRVPERHFHEAMEQIRAVEPGAKVLSESMKGADMTTEFVDVESHIKTLRGEEEQYRLILSKASKIPDVLSVRDRLGQVRYQIESLESRRRAIAQSAAFSTISVSLTQAPKVTSEGPRQHWAEESWNNALALLAKAGQTTATGGIYIFLLTPLWLPLAIGSWYLIRRTP